mmetsp:Transcript_31371/g.61961  ORF Transcript_31371/g.61961 Transcript_31371/m.61961 type:complete len:91 (+) Transcript_31371:234-506(+)
MQRSPDKKKLMHSACLACLFLSPPRVKRLGRRKTKERDRRTGEGRINLVPPSQPASLPCCIFSSPCLDWKSQQERDEGSARMNYCTNHSL